MQEMSLLEWVNSPQTQALKAWARHQQQPAVRQFLAGRNLVEPLTQGRAAAFHDVELLLSLPVDDLRRNLEERK